MWRLRLSEDLVDRQILCRVGEERLIRAPGQQSVQFADIHFPGYQDVLAGRDSVVQVVFNLVIAVKR